MGVSSPDSQYGFTSGANGDCAVEGAPYTVIDSRAQVLHPECATDVRDALTEGGLYSWGPPPPYTSNPTSTNNSPARRTIGGLLNQVSPRRNNISPARFPRNRFMRQPVCFNRPTNTQVAKNQPTRAPPRPSTLTSAMQRQIAVTSSNKSISMTSITPSNSEPRPESYENTSAIERIYQNRKMNNNSVSGFNTLPSLKKRNQPELDELFEKLPSSSSFTSADNLGADHDPDEMLYKCSVNDACSIEKDDKVQPLSDIYQNGQFAKKKVVRKLEYPTRPNGEKPQVSKSAVRRPLVKPPRSTPGTSEQTVMKTDQDLVKKHGCLIKELSRRTQDCENGFENFGFQHLEKDGSKGSFKTENNGMEIALIGYNPHVKKFSRKCADRECESDVYFGDISNSSCYMSIRSEVPESLYEETLEAIKDQNGGQPFLNKTNLELIEKENNKLDVKTLDYADCLASASPSSLESTASRTSSDCKRLRDSSDHSLESFCSNRSGFPSYSKAETSLKLDVFTKHRDVALHHQLPNQFRPVREPTYPINSNDEQSSSSLTADSGISSARHYIPRGYYCDKALNENLSADSECSLDGVKTSSTDGGFVPIKPKIHPRGTRNHETVEDFDGKSRTKKGKKNYSPGEDDQPPNPKPRATKTPGSSPKPLPRTTIPKLKYSEPTNGIKSFLAPDAQYDFKESCMKSNRAKISRVVHGSPRSKPSVPARPLHLTTKSGEKLFQSLATSQRRRPAEEISDLDAADCQPTTSRSVNV